MLQTSEVEQGALKLAEIIEDAAHNPEKAVERIEAKTDSQGIMGTIIGFIKDYTARDKSQSNQAWLEQQFAKPEYADAWKGGNAEQERAEAAKALVQDIDDYEDAKKSLRTHIALGGTRASWLAEQIEIGAARNNKDPAEYAKEIEAGFDAARKENADFLLGVENDAQEAK